MKVCTCYEYNLKCVRMYVRMYVCTYVCLFCKINGMETVFYLNDNRLKLIARDSKG